MASGSSRWLSWLKRQRVKLENHQLSELECLQRFVDNNQSSSELKLNFWTQDLQYRLKAVAPETKILMLVKEPQTRGETVL